MRDEAESWHHLCTPGESRDRLVLTLVQLLVDKGVITEEELWHQAEPSRQQLVSEDEARRQWHTTWLPTEEDARAVEHRVPTWGTAQSSFPPMTSAASR